MTATQTQIRRDTATNLDAATPAAGELAYDTTNKQLRIGDGSTLGGIKIPNSFYLQNQSMIAGTAGGSADALTLTVTPAPATLATFQRFVFKAASDNATTTPTLAVNGGTAKIIKKKSSTGLAALAAGDIQADVIYTATYDGTNFQLEAVDIAPATVTGVLLNTNYYSMPQKTFTVTIASPAVLTVNAQSCPQNGALVRLTTTGALPTGLATGVTYYVVGASDGGTTFNLSATRGGSAINTSGSQSGTHTADSAPYVKSVNNPTYIIVEAVGAGGAGGTSRGGGGAGAYAIKKILASDLGASETMAIGLATTGAGALTSFGTTPFISVGGGTGGSGSTSYAGGSGGSSDTTGADFTSRGQSGGMAQNGTAGCGGATPFGGSSNGSGAGSNGNVGYSGGIKISEYS